MPSQEEDDNGMRRDRFLHRSTATSFALSIPRSHDHQGGSSFLFLNRRQEEESPSSTAKSSHGDTTSTATATATSTSTATATATATATTTATKSSPLELLARLSSSDEEQKQKQRRIPKEVWNLVAGGLAGMAAKTVVAPMDRIKIMYQVTDAKFYWKDVANVMRRIVGNEGGVFALWRGNTATMIRVFPYAGVQFMMFDRCKTFFLSRKNKRTEHHHNHHHTATVVGDDEHCTAPATIPAATHPIDTSDNTHSQSITTNNNTNYSAPQSSSSSKTNGLTPLESLMSGSFAGAVSVILTYPLDLTRAQLAIQGRNQLSSNNGRLTSGFLSVLTANYQNGGLSGLYRGITPTLLGILPYAGIAFTINEQTKGKIREIAGREPSTLERLMAGALSGLVAQSITYPLEVTRRRMQASALLSHGSHATAELPALGGAHIQAITNKPGHRNPNMIQVMLHLFRHEGITGFFKGLSVNWIKGPVAFAISFTAYDKIKGIITPKEHQQSHVGQI